MHIELLKMTLKNFLGVANVPLVLDLARTPLTLFKGTNGSGKSTILDALCFVLYKTSYRDVNLPLLVNFANNKDCVVEIDFTVGENAFRVVRGQKSAVFEIYKNGVLINQESTVPEYQRMLEQDILGMNYTTFVQTVILGSRSFVPFMKLKTSERRIVIDDIFPVKYIGQMLEELKADISQIKDRLEEISKEIKLCEIKLEAERNHKALTESHSDENRKKTEASIVNLTNEIEGYEKARDSLLDRQATLIAKIDTIGLETHEKAFNACSKGIHNLEARITTIDEELTFYHDHDRCPTCRQKIDDKFKELIVENKRKRQQDLGLEMVELEAKKKMAKQAISSFEFLDEEMSDIRSEIKSIDRLILSCQRNRAEAQKELEQELVLPARYVDYDANIDKINKDIRKLRAEKKELDINAEVCKINMLILKDDGYKAKEIRRLLPLLNARITYYLNLLDYPCHFELDETFNAVVRSRNRDKFVYNSFSEGQKLRIDLSILFAFRYIAQQITSMSSNLLIMDEILDGPFDAAGMNEAMECIKRLAEADGINIILISPKGEQLATSFFDEIYDFKLVKDVTKMTKEK